MIVPVEHIYHRPVLVAQVVEALRVCHGGSYVDCTLGEGGHAEVLLAESSTGGRLLGLDADSVALGVSVDRLRQYQEAFTPVRANFHELASVAIEQGFEAVDGILFDLGISALQLEGEGRGFSFWRDEPMDMRIDLRQTLTATDVVNTWPEEDLSRAILSFGEEHRARRIAHAIVEHRPLYTSQELADVVQRATGYRRGRTHPATRTFQAIRIAVNRELEFLEKALPQAVSLLRSGGRLAIISYHSLEDRIVKVFLRRESRDCLCPTELPFCKCGHLSTIRLVNRKVVTPTAEEVEANPRSRSAKLRVAERY